MKKLATILALVTIFAAGCGKESQPGGPGATNGAATNGAATDGAAKDRTADKERTFTITVPGTTVDIDQGEQDEVTIKLNRGSEFKETVNVAFDAPAGVTISPATAELKQGENEVKITLTATNSATVGKHRVTVKATPQTGPAVAEPFDLEVNARDDDEDAPRTEPVVP
ncbi:MAG: hypothetical protein WD069_12710 [Planctomycetales bacterium]